MDKYLNQLSKTYKNIQEVSEEIINLQAILNLPKGTELFLSEDGLKNSSAKLVSKGDLLLALYGATSGEIGISKIDGAINQAILWTNEQGSLLWVLFFTPSTAEAVPLPLRMEAVPPRERLSVTLSHIEANCFSDINPANLRYTYGAIFPYGSDMLCGA